MSSTTSVSQEENTELALFLLKQRLSKIHHILHEKLSIFSSIVQQSLFVDLDISTMDGRQTANSVSNNTNSSSIKQKLLNLKDQIIKINYSDVIALIDSAVEEQILREQFFAKKRAQVAQPLSFQSLNMIDQPKITPKIEFDDGNEYTSTISSSLLKQPTISSKNTVQWRQDNTFQDILTTKPIANYQNNNNTTLSLKQSKLTFSKELKAQYPKNSHQSYPLISKNIINPIQNSFNNSNARGSYLPLGISTTPKRSSIILMTQKMQDYDDTEMNTQTKQAPKSIYSSVPILSQSKSIKKDTQMKIQQKRNAQKENIDNNCNKDEGELLQPKITRQSPIKGQKRKPLKILRKKQEEDEQAEGQTTFFFEYLKNLIEQSTKCQLEVPKIFKNKQFYEQRCDPQFKSVGTRLSHKDKSFVVKLFKALDGKSLYSVHDLLKLPPTLVSGLILRAIKGEFDSDGEESEDEIRKGQNRRDYGEEEEEDDEYDGKDRVVCQKMRNQYEEIEEKDDIVYEDYNKVKQKQGKRLMFNV